ncbi:MAG: HAD hydrolase-like protein [Thermoplasmata archaeon]
MCNKINYKVLITCGGGFQGKGLMDLINSTKLNIQIHLCDTNYDNINKYEADSFHLAPSVLNKDEYIKFLFDIIQKYKIDFIIPCTPIDTIILSEIKKEAFEKFDTKVLVPDKSVLKHFTQKDRTIVFLKSKGLPTVETVNIKNVSPQKFIPIITKPKEGSGSKGIINIHTYSDLQKILNIIDADKYLFCRLLNNYDEYSIDFSVSYEGIVSDFVCRKRIFTSLGFALVSEIDWNVNTTLQRDLNVLRKIFQHPAFSGIYNIQVLKDLESNIFYFNDLNPRIGTSSVASVFSGYNILDVVFLNSKPQPLTKRKTNPVKVIRTLCTYSLPQKIKIKNIIFDLDGTLVNTYDFIIRRTLYIFKKHIQKKDKIQRIDYLNEITQIIQQNKLENLIDILSVKYKIDKDILLNDYVNYLPKIKLYPDVIRVLSILREKKINLILITRYSNLNTHYYKIKFVEEYFNHIELVKEKYSEQNKNNIFKDVLIKLNIKPKDTASVGDNLNQDIIPSLKCNLKKTFYLKRTPNYIPITNLADYLNLGNNYVEITSLKELLNYVE